MSGRLKNKIAVVTGAAAGIGKGCAQKFRNEGAIVVGVDKAGADYNCDLLDESATNELFDQIEELHGQVDILVNAAAFAVFAWVDEMTHDEWRRTIAGELDIVFLPTRAAWPLMKAADGASIINFASVNAYHALDGSPAIAHCAGKGGVLAMTRQLAMEGSPHNIRANSISPGFIRTEATKRHLDADPGLEEKVMAKNMLKRLGEPEDIAWLAVYLGSDESTYVTGADFSVDAGATAW